MRTLGRVWPYAAALLSLAALCWLKAGVGEYLAATFTLLLVPVAVGAWLGGAVPGLVALLVSSVVGNYFFIHPSRAGRLPDGVFKARMAA